MDESKKTDTNDDSSELLSHSAQILKAASPYLDPSIQKSLESVVRLSDFMETIQQIRRTGLPALFPSNVTTGDTVSMSSLKRTPFHIDSEALLSSIRPFCTKREGSIIDQILSFFRIQKAFSMYQSVMSMMNMMNAGTETSDSNNDMNQTMAMAMMMSQMMNGNSNMDMSQMMNVASMMNQMNENSSSEPTTKPPDNPDLSKASNEKESSNETTNSSDATYQDTYWNSFNQPDQNQKQSSSGTSNNNRQMMDLISTMVPPEQKSTFDTLCHLMESGIIK